MKTTFSLAAILALGRAHPSPALEQEKTLAQVVVERPFPEYSTWWAIGSDFASFMSDAIVSEWSALSGSDRDLDRVKGYFSEYVERVYGSKAGTSLVDDFVRQDFREPLQSGEFDALSYAFFRSAFELLAQQFGGQEASLEKERRLFTKRVGKRFFSRVEDRLHLNVPSRMDDEASFSQLKECIGKVGAFLIEQGYYRDGVAFRFDVEVEHRGKKIVQRESDVLSRLERDGSAYALFEMSYPIILPSAVYLFHTLGEAQHHSSRTLEELFERVGYEAGETEDFDPMGFPSDLVVELWVIRKKR